MVICPVCGNDVHGDCSRCVYCDALIDDNELAHTKPRIIYKNINLERGRPIVEAALKRMYGELEQARISGVKIVTLIHGYGSSGKGGKIRVACRKSLDYLLQQGGLKRVVHGERFHKNAGVGKALIRQYPELKELCRTDFNNPGITVVEF